MGYFVLVTGVVLIVLAGGFGSAGESGTLLDDFAALSIGGGLLIAGGLAALAHRWGTLIAWGGCGIALGTGILRFSYLQTRLESLPNAVTGTFVLIPYAAICAGIFFALTLELRASLADDSES